MKRVYVYDRELDKMVEVKPEERQLRHEVMPDIGRYRSMVDGSVIEGRSQHREHLKRHGVRNVEPGEVRQEDILKYRKNYSVAKEHRFELIRSQVDAMTHDQFRRAVNKDIQNWKWNTRED